MSINADLSRFDTFGQTAVRTKGGDDFVARTTTKKTFTLGGSRIVSVSAGTDDVPRAFSRSQESKDANLQARQEFMSAIKRQFNGRPVPKSVLDAFDNGVCDKPLTARRINAVMTEVRKAIAPRLPDVSVVKDGNPVAKAPLPNVKIDVLEQPRVFAENVDVTPDSLSGVTKNVSRAKEYEEQLAAWKEKFGYRRVEKHGWFFNSVVEEFAAGVDKEEAMKSRPREPVGYVASEGNERPTKYYLTMKKGMLPPFTCSLTYTTAKPTPEMNKLVRQAVAQVYEGLLAKANLPVAARDELLRPYLDPETITEPMSPADETVKKLIDTVRILSGGNTYVDTVSQGVHRADVRVNFNTFSRALLRPLIGELGKMLPGGGSLVVEGAKIGMLPDGSLKLELQKLRKTAPAVGEAVPEEPAPKNKGLDIGAIVKSVLKSLPQAGTDVSVVLKPGAYDRATGKLHLALKSVDTNNVPLKCAITNGLSFAGNAINDKLSNPEKMLSGAYGENGNLFDFDLDLNRIGFPVLNSFGLNGSVAGNLHELKFDQNGVTLRVGDAKDPVNGPVGPQEPVPLAQGGSTALDLNLSLTDMTKNINLALRKQNLFEYSRFSLSTSVPQGQRDGVLKVKFGSLKIYDFLKQTAGGFIAGAAKLLGLDCLSDVSVEVRPSLDPKTGKMRLDLVSFDADQFRGGVGAIVKKFLPGIIKDKLEGFIKGPDPKKSDKPESPTVTKIRTSLKSVAPKAGGTSVVSAELDFKTLLEKFLPKHDMKVSKFQITRNGLSLALAADE